MEDGLISKKELLSITGISYGQLYRWKRKGLIPEEWFIRRSSYTGQETFFPREKVLERVDRIKDMKGDVSLDDLAGVFSPKVDDISLSADNIVQRGIVRGEVAALYADIFGKSEYGFDDMAYMSVLEALIETGGAGREEAASAVRTLRGGAGAFKDGFCELFAVRKLGVFACFLAASPCEIRFEEGIKLIARISIPAVKEKLKLKLL